MAERACGGVADQARSPHCPGRAEPQATAESDCDAASPQSDPRRGGGSARASVLREQLRQRGALRLAVADGAAGEAFAAFLGDAAEVAVGGDFAREAWRKLCANAVSGVMALAGRPAEIFALDDVRAIATALAYECAAVARAEGAPLSDDDADEVITWIGDLPPDAGSSILTDRLAGRELEWEARNAVIGRLARRHDIPTPVSDTVAALLHAASDGSA